MHRRQFTALSASLWPVFPAHLAHAQSGDAAAGIRAALERGAIAAVGLLGKEGGFWDNPQARIPLPGFLKDAAKLLKATGQGAKVDELLLAMNRAAERAVPQARTLLVEAARSVTLQDAWGIVRGGDTSVTDYFSGRTREPLGQKFLPIVTQATQKVALAEKYNAVAGKAASLGLVKGHDAKIELYVTDKTLDALYRGIADEERRIRRDPAGSGVAILKQVFGR